MPFNNPIIGNTALIRDAIESQNYVPGIAGWKISKDGIAEFNDLVTRGYASGPNASYDVINANDDLYYRGTSLEEYLDSSAKGIIAYGVYDIQSGLIASNTEPVFFHITFTAKAHRRYEIIISNFYISKTQVQGTYGHVWLSSDGQNASPHGANSTLYTVFDRQSIFVAHLGANSDGDTIYDICLSVLNMSGSNVYVSGSAGAVGSQGAQVYIIDQGANPNLVDTGIIIPAGASPPPPPPAYTYKSFQIYPVSTASYGENGSVLSDGSNNKLYQGAYAGAGSFGGNRYSYINFGGSLIGGVSSDKLAYFQLGIYCEHTYQSGGAPIRIGYVDNYGTPHIAYATVNMVQGQYAWINLMPSISTPARLGNMKYILIGSAPDYSNVYYAIMNGTLSGNGPQLKSGYYVPA